MKNKGFTLIELLSVIVLIGLLMGLAVPGVTRIKSNMAKRSLTTKIKQIEQAATLWGQDNKGLIKGTCSGITHDDNSCTSISIGLLLEEDYIESDNYSGDIKDPTNNENIIDNCVYVYKYKNRVYAKYDKNTTNCIYEG